MRPLEPGSHVGLVALGSSPPLAPPLGDKDPRGHLLLLSPLPPQKNLRCSRLSSLLLLSKTRGQSRCRGGRGGPCLFPVLLGPNFHTVKLTHWKCFQCIHRDVETRLRLGSDRSHQPERNPCL